MIVLGVDPGSTGGLTIIDTVLCTVIVLDMPTEIVVKQRQLTSALEFASIVNRLGVEAAFVEDVWARPNEGPVGAFSFGRGVGRLEGVLDSLRIRRWSIKPQDWKSKLKVSASKELAVRRAQELFPEAASVFIGSRGGLKHGRAESALLALYGCLRLSETPTKPLTLIQWNND